MFHLPLITQDAKLLLGLLQNSEVKKDLADTLQFLEKQLIKIEEDTAFFYESYDDDLPKIENPMIYSEYSFEQAKELLNLATKRVELFPNIQPEIPSEYIEQTLTRGLKLPLINEKVRSEVLIMPLLLEVKEIHQDKIALLSGATLNVEKERGLWGRCDFLLSQNADAEIPEVPLFALVEAKHQNIEGGLGQTMAQMLALKLFNEQKNKALDQIYGGISTGQIWQFLKLKDNIIYIDRKQYFINQLPELLDIFQQIILSTQQV